MGIISVPRMFFPRPPVGVSAQLTNITTALLIDAADETATYVVEAPKTGNIDAIYWGVNAVTTGATVDVRIETLNRAATPAVNSGTLWGTNTNASQVVTSTGQRFTTVLTAAAAVTLGEMLAVVIKNPSSSFGNMRVGGLADDADMDFPYCLSNGAAAIACPLLGLRYDDGNYYPTVGCYPINAGPPSITYNSSSTPDTWAQRFQLPVPVRVCGFWNWHDFDGDFTVKLVSSDYNQGANTATTKIEKAVNNEDRKTASPGYTEYLFSGTVDLAANTNYRLVYEPEATSIQLYELTFDSLALMGGMEGGGNWHASSAKDPTDDGSWTNYNSGTFRRLLSGLIINGLHDGSGSSRGVIIGG